MSQRIILPLLAFGVGLAIATGAQAKCCSCQSSSCSVSICCSGGCGAACGGSSCTAECFGGGGDCLDPDECLDQQAGVQAAPSATVSVALVDAGAEEVSESLSKLLGRQVAFLPRTADGMISLDLQGVPTDEIMGFLARHGAFAILEQPVQAARGSASGSEQRISLHAEGIDGEGLARLLGLALGREKEVHFRSRAPGELYNLDIKSASPRELFGYLTRLGVLEVVGLELDR